MISLTLNYATAEELRNALVVMLGTVPVPVPVPVPMAPVVEQEAPKAPKPAKAAKPSATSESPAATQTVSATTTPPPSEPPPAAAEPATESPSEPAPAFTLEDVRAVLAKLSQAGKASQVKALIAETGAANLSSVPADKYSELLEKAAAL